jgi:zinc protease
MPAWAGHLPVSERTLANGLKALVVPRACSPVVVCDLYYPVGSVDEPAGRTGLAHFVEHMLFKGTARFPKGQIDRLAFLAAGQLNAETGEDSTRYWFALPRERWELPLIVEADRMLGATFDSAEVEAERQVIVEERARELESPLSRLEQTHLAMSYLVHPYRNPVLGWPEDLKRASVEDLRSFYATHYRPDGAVLVVVGSLEPERVLDRIEALFSHIQANSITRPEPPADEPPQTGRRDFTLVESESAARGVFGWHTVALGHRDEPALDVLTDILSCGRRSRLWDTLVERERLATWVDTGQEGSLRAGQLLLHVEAAPGIEPERIETRIREVLTRLANEGPNADELRRSRHRLEAAWRWEQQDPAGLASGLGHVALRGDWRAWQAEHRAALAVDADDIRHVATSYLVERNLTVGWLLPRPNRTSIVAARSNGATSVARSPLDDYSETPLAIAVPSGPSTLKDYAPRRMVLPNGLRVVTETRTGTGTVALELYVDAGQMREKTPGLAYVTGRMLEEGTRSRSAEELAEAIEDVGGSLEVGSTGISLRVRSENLELAVEILADVALRPAFPVDAFGWIKRRVAAELRSDREDPAFRAEQLFRERVYRDHPYARDPRGTLGNINRLKLEDVAAHHTRFFGADNAFLVVAGDFEPRQLKTLVAKHLAHWSRLRRPVPRRAAPVADAGPSRRFVKRPGEQVHILLGHLGIPRDHPDFYAMVAVDHILGSGPGFTDRLSRKVRDQLGLAYAVGGGMTDSADILPGLFRVYVGTSPDQADRAIAAAMEEILAMQDGDFSDDEVERAVGYAAGAWVFDFQTVPQRAERLLELERWGMALDEPLRWPERMGSVTPEQARDAARRHIRPDALVQVQYGPIRESR